MKRLLIFVIIAIVLSLSACGAMTDKVVYEKPEFSEIISDPDAYIGKDRNVQVSGKIINITDETETTDGSRMLLILSPDAAAYHGGYLILITSDSEWSDNYHENTEIVARGEVLDVMRGDSSYMVTIAGHDVEIIG